MVLAPSPRDFPDRRFDSDPVFWQPVRRAPALAPGDLHLWRIRTGEDGASVEADLALLGERQRARAGRMSHRVGRDRYVRSQAGLRRVLALYLEGRPGAIDFVYGPAGKPRLPGTQGWLEFNLTNTGDLALVGISRGIELGVDCEWIRPRRDLDAVARRMFAPDVAQSLAETPEPERLQVFYRAWTAREADAKCDGRGLFRPRAEGAQPPRIGHLIPQPGYVAAVARAFLPPPSRWMTLEPTETR